MRETSLNAIWFKKSLDNGQNEEPAIKLAVRNTTITTATLWALQPISKNQKQLFTSFISNSGFLQSSKDQAPD